MSVLDEFRAAEQRVAERMRELQPLAIEYRELEQLAQRLGLLVDDAGASVAGNGASRQRNGDRGGRAGAARTRERASRRRGSSSTTPRKQGDTRRASRRDDIVRLVAQRPGITVREVGHELQVDPTGLYKPVRKLQNEGVIVKRGVQLMPAGTAT